MVGLTQWLVSQLNTSFSWVLVAQEHHTFPFVQLHDLDISSAGGHEETAIRHWPGNPHPPGATLYSHTYLDVVFLKCLKLLF